MWALPFHACAVKTSPFTRVIHAWAHKLDGSGLWIQAPACRANPYHATRVTVTLTVQAFTPAHVGLAISRLCGQNQPIHACHSRLGPQAGWVWLVDSGPCMPGKPISRY